MIWNKMFKVFLCLAAATVASACSLDVSGLNGGGGAADTGSSSTASVGASGVGGTTSSGASNTASSTASSGASSSSGSSSSSGGSSSSSSGSGGTTDGCANPADKVILADNNAMLQAAHDCGVSCGGGGTCASACMVMNKKISGACGGCWGDFIACAAASCGFPCGVNPTGSNCKNCTAANDCDSAYHMCSGV